MDLPIKLFRLSIRRHLYRYKWHVTVRLVCLNSTVIPSVKASIKTYTLSYCLVFLIPSILTGIPSVYTDDIFPSVFTNRVSTWKNLIGKSIYKNLHIIVLFGFFNSLYSDWDFLGIYRWYISVGIYQQS
jgi:hypothetical protein